MNTQTPMGAVGASLDTSAAQLPQRMRVNVQEVSNGFLVTLGLKIGWGENQKIAAAVARFLAE